jgi:hypothetical protein
MATSGSVIERFAEVSGLLPSTLDRVLRILRDAELAPMGDKGRGLKRGHYEPHHLCNVLLAFAGPQPSDAAEAVRLLRTLRYASSDGDVVDHLPEEGEPLAEFIEDMIYWLSDPATDETAKRINPSDIEFTFCLDPLFAQVLIIEQNGHGRNVRSYLPPQQPLPLSNAPQRLTSRVRRLTTIGLDTMLVAGDLWRDTLAHQEKSQDPSQLDAPASAPPETKPPQPLQGKRRL